MVHHVIYEELCLGKVLPESRQQYSEVIRALETRGEAPRERRQVPISASTFNCSAEDASGLCWPKSVSAIADHPKSC